jgi:hypothetical protein
LHLPRPTLYYAVNIGGEDGFNLTQEQRQIAKKSAKSAANFPTPTGGEIDGSAYPDAFVKS